MSQSGQTFLFFIKCPKLDDLVSLNVILLVDKQHAKHSVFNQRIFKCRELIFSESDIVSTPDQHSENQIIVVLPKNRFNTPQFKQQLDKIGLKLLRVDDVSPAILQECLQYTVISKLAPQWNLVQNLMVQGRDFLATSTPLKAVYLDTVVNDGEITLCIKPTCIKLPHFKIENYINLNEPQRKFFSIDEKCHVLPSLKVGHAISISKEISTSTSTLKTYSDLKKYWKNMYGYRLPDVPEQNIWYVNIKFNVRWTPLTYPSFCIRPYGMTEVPRVNPQPTLQAFIADFCKKIGSICGEKCQVLDLRASFPALKMYPAVDIIENATPKVGTTYTMVPEKPYRSAVASRVGNAKINLYRSIIPGSQPQNPKHDVKDSAENKSKNLLSKLPTPEIFCDPKSCLKPSSMKHNKEIFELSNVSSQAKTENVQFNLFQDANDDSRYFKKLKTKDLSFLSTNFQELQLQTHNKETRNNSDTRISTSVEPRHAPQFLPRQPNIRTLTEMFPKVKTPLKRKFNLNDDSKANSPSSSSTECLGRAASVNSFGKKFKASNSRSRDRCDGNNQ